MTTTVTVSRDFPTPDSQPTFLPLPYPAIQVYAPGKWLADPDLMVYSTSDSIAGRSYSVASVRVDPSQAQLEAVPGLVKTAALQRDLQLPSSYQTTALKKLADSYTASQTTEFGKVDALANWLSGGQFSYNLNAAPLNSAASLLNFLTKTKTGFCVQYAYAMTTLTRLLGFPARFVVGYTAGTRLKNGTYEVKNTDAHAWTEVYFPSLGWIRFEPTPAGQGTANPPNYMTSGTGPGQGSGTDPIVKETQGAGINKTGPNSNGTGQSQKLLGGGGSAAGTAGGRAGAPWTAVALAVIAAIALAFGLIAIAAPPAQRVLFAHSDAPRLRKPLTATTAVAAVAAAGWPPWPCTAAVPHQGPRPGPAGAGWATIGIASRRRAAAALITPAIFRLVLRRWRWMPPVTTPAAPTPPGANSTTTSPTSASPAAPANHPARWPPASPPRCPNPPPPPSPGSPWPKNAPATPPAPPDHSTCAATPPPPAARCPPPPAAPRAGAPSSCPPP